MSRLPPTRENLLLSFFLRIPFIDLRGYASFRAVCDCFSAASVTPRWLPRACHVCRSSGGVFRVPFSGLREQAARRPRSRLRGYSNLRVRNTCPQRWTVCWCSVCACFGEAGVTTCFCFCLCAVQSPPWVRRVSLPKRIAYSYVRVRGTCPQRGAVCCCSVCICFSETRVGSVLFCFLLPV